MDWLMHTDMFIQTCMHTHSKTNGHKRTDRLTHRHTDAPTLTNHPLVKTRPHTAVVQLWSHYYTTSDIHWTLTLFNHSALSTSGKYTWKTQNNIKLAVMVNTSINVLLYLLKLIHLKNLLCLLKTVISYSDFII